LSNDLKCHVFICTKCSSTKERERGGELCEAQALRNSTKKKSKEIWGKSVRINKSGCLGKCDEGIACVLYPSQVWLTGLTDEGTNEVITAIEQALKA